MQTHLSTVEPGPPTEVEFPGQFKHCDSEVADTALVKVFTEQLEQNDKPDALENVP